jgi:hypothetical protein
LLILLLAANAWPQDSDTGADADEPEPAQTEASEEEDAELDEGSYVDAEDDDFRPSEDIPADQSIPFPTDI